MIKIIAVLLLFFTPLMAMESKAPEVEMYSDEKPKSKSILTGTVPEECYQQFYVSKWHTLSKVVEHLEKTLPSKGFKHLGLEGSFYEEAETESESEDLLFVSLQNPQHLFLEIHYKKESLIPILRPIELKAHDSVFKKDKWSYPIKVSYWGGKTEHVNEMSWKYIDFQLHGKFMVLHDNPYFDNNPFEEKLYKDIRSQGLSLSIIRSLIIIDQDNQFSWNILYDTDIEMKTGEEFLSELKDVF